MLGLINASKRGEGFYSLKRTIADLLTKPFITRFSSFLARFLVMNSNLNKWPLWKLSVPLSTINRFLWPAPLELRPKSTRKRKNDIQGWNQSIGSQPSRKKCKFMFGFLLGAIVVSKLVDFFVRIISAWFQRRFPTAQQSRSVAAIRGMFTI